MNEQEQQDEIELDRKGERWLILKAFIALIMVAVLIVIRRVFVG
jgi:uncharacterized integral membrane protein